MLSRNQSQPVKSDPNAHQQKLVVGFVPIVKEPDGGCSGKNETGKNGAKGKLHRWRDERPVVALRLAPDEECIQRKHNDQGSEPKRGKAAGRNVPHHFRSDLRPMTLARPDRRGQPERNHPTGKRGRGGDGAVNGGAFHQGSNDPQMLFGALAFVHLIYFVIQSSKTGKQILSSRVESRDPVARFKISSRVPRLRSG